MSHLYTLDETISDQGDLESLCKDRQLKTEEIFKPNAYYGIDKIIKAYTGIPFDQPLKAIFPHGVSLSNDFIWEEERNALIPVIFYYELHRYQVYKSKSNKVILPSAAPYIYLLELLRNKQNISRKGTIFFLSHSTHHVTTSVDFEKIIRALQALEDKYKPVTVCVYWRDYHLGHHAIFKEQGYNIVSAGHMFDPCFLFRLYHLCSLHRFSTSNELGSHLFYSVKAGCSFFFMDPIEQTRKSPKDIEKRDVSTPCPKIVNDLRRFFSIPRINITTEQLETVDKYLGTVFLRTPIQLKRELLFADRLDKFGFARNPKSKQMYYRMPNLIPRKLLRNIKRKFINSNK